ncbi:BnaC04g42600D [Brassica napus]|uniref:BnaC04g42600D protein n=1 Tax=Brassica napus TaxID=3708 RepID=A0A078FST1_BRANA|nr:BnaC04g42600D [Brassica napus]
MSWTLLVFSGLKLLTYLIILLLCSLLGILTRWLHCKGCWSPTVYAKLQEQGVWHWLVHQEWTLSIFVDTLFP